MVEIHLSKQLDGYENGTSSFIVEKKFLAKGIGFKVVIKCQ
jgi:hypothetical protein